MKLKRLQMDNGCELVVRTISDAEGGVPIIMWGGIFGTYLVWSRLAKELRKHHPLVIIDYPQFALSSELFFHKQLNVKMLASFQKEAMAQLQIPKAVTMGWSTGTQIAAEFAGMYPNETSSLVAINGVLEHPFKHISDPIFETIGIRPKLSQTVGWLTQQEETVKRLRRIIKRNDHPSRWAKRLGLVSPSVDELVMDAVIRDFVNMPTRHYDYYLQITANHSAKALLKNSPFPILAVSGSLDKLVPPKRTKAFVNKNNPNNEFLLVKGATHFAPLEYPQLLALKFEDFRKRNHIK